MAAVNAQTSAVYPPLALRDGLTALVNPIDLDGRVAWYADEIRGFTCVNCYLLSEGAQALLVDTGVTVHRDAVIAQLRSAVSAAVISITFTRIAEYPAVCNATAIAEHIPVEALYAQFPGALSWVEFRPRAERPHGIAWAIGRPPESRLSGPTGDVPVGGGRALIAIRPPVKLLPSLWLYDERSRTLFTGDMFSHAYRPTAAGPWLADDDALGIDADGVLAHLLERCWWLAEAKAIDRLRRDLAGVFDDHVVETIAPGYGCLIDGADNVARHYDLLQGALARLEHGADG